MVTKPDTRSRLPRGLSPQEEAAWWDAHQDYWDSQNTPEEVVSPVSRGRTRPVTLRLPLAMIDSLKGEAARRAIPYQTLIRMWLKEQLDRSAMPAGISGANARPAQVAWAA